MRYQNVVEGVFLQRMNRFVAWVRVNGAGARCHVKNTGRLKELFVSGARCVLAVSNNPNRATAYDLVGIWRGDVLVNVDSQAPNAAAREWVAAGGLGGGVTLVKPEYTWGNSRFDLYAERLAEGEAGGRADALADSEATGREADVPAESEAEKAHRNTPSDMRCAVAHGTGEADWMRVEAQVDSALTGTECPGNGQKIADLCDMAPQGNAAVERLLIEVKGVTLNVDGEARFPDAPTDRGVKHVRELIHARQRGYRACILFVIQMPDATGFAPNDATHPEFGEALRDAARAGVEIHAVLCENTLDSMTMTREVPVRLGVS